MACPGMVDIAQFMSNMFQIVDITGNFSAVLEQLPIQPVQSGHEIFGSNLPSGKSYG
jgi:hypothetical protein